MDDFRALPQLSEAIEKMISKGEARLATVVKSYDDGTVDAQMWDGSVGRFASTHRMRGAGKKGVLIAGLGGSKIFLPLDLGNIHEVSNQSTLQVDYPNRLEIVNGLKLETAIDGARISVDSDVMAQRNWVANNYYHITTMDAMLNARPSFGQAYNLIIPWASTHAEDPSASTTGIDPLNPRWIGGQHTLIVPPGNWHLYATITYTNLILGAGQGVSLNFDFRGANYYTVQYGNPVRTYTIHALPFTVTNPNWEVIYFRPGFTGVWAAGTSYCQIASVSGILRRVG